MIRIREQRSLNRDREHPLKRTTVGSIENGTTLNPLKRSRQWHEGLGKMPARTGPDVERFENNLSFLSVRSAIRDYPDTGESGDAYDAEAFH